MRSGSRAAAWPVLALACALAALGCDHSGARLILQKDLAPGAVPRTAPVLIAAADAGKTVFTGDYSDDPPTVAANRERLAVTFPAKIASALQAAGLQASVASEAAPAEGAVLITLEVKMFDAGWAAQRAWVGSRSHLLTAVKVTRGGATVAELTLDAYSDWHDEIQARLDGHVDDTVARLAGYLAEKIAP